jgi:hypothetical protein
MGITQQIGASSIIKPGVCTSSTRPASPYEGQMIYTTDLDTLEIWNGTAWRITNAATVTSGSVLQVVNANSGYTSGFTTTSATFASTGLTATITPKSNTSNILILVSQPNRKTNDNSQTEVFSKLYRGVTAITDITSTCYTNSNLELRVSSSLCHLDSPATTSETTYTMYGAASSGAASFNFFSVGYITLMEISA